MQNLLIILSITFFGTLLAKVIVKDLNWPLSLSTGFITGIGLTTFLLFAMSWTGIKITNNSAWCIVLSLLTISMTSFLLLKRKFKFDKIVFSKNEKIGFALILGLLLLSLLISNYYPVTVWDALALYDFRGKVIADLGYFVQISSQFDYFSHYPVHTSLMHTIIYLTGGSNPQFLYSLYLLSFSVLYYSFLRRRVKSMIAVVATILLVTTPDIFEHSTIAYTNLPYTIAYVSGLLYLFFAFIESRHDYILLSSILIGISTWVRSDLPFWLTGIIFTAIYSIKSKRVKPLIMYLIPFLIIQQTWNRFAAMSFGRNYSTSGQLIEAGGLLFKMIDLGRATEVLHYVYKNIILAWGPLAFLFVLSLIINLIRKKNNTLILLSMIAINFLGLVVGTYVFSFKVTEWREIADSATRMAMFFPPLIIFYISLVISDNN